MALFPCYNPMGHTAPFLAVHSEAPNNTERGHRQPNVTALMAHVDDVHVCSPVARKGGINCAILCGGMISKIGLRETCQFAILIQACILCSIEDERQSLA
jgi:hypothetical protein